MEESFPRGGSQVAGTKRKTTKSDDQNELVVPSAKRKKTAKKSKKNKTVTPMTGISETIGIKDEMISEPTVIMHKHLSVGMLILGCVKEVHDFELLVSLPNGHTGVVAITHLCDAYTTALQSLAAHDQMSDQQDVSTLEDLFHIGQVVRAKILEIPKKAGIAAKKLIKLSLNPRDVNHSLTVGALRNGMVLTGCVSSREDHGYVLDLGIQGASCFVRTSQAETYSTNHNDGKPLTIGSYLHCTVSRSNKPGSTELERSIRVKIEPSNVHKRVVTDDMDISLDILIPGMVVECTVIRRTDEGVAVKFLSFKGRVHQSHLLKDPTHYDVHDKIKCAVLFVDPTLKVVTLTQLGHLVTPDPVATPPFGGYIVGDIVEGAKLLRTDKLLGVFLKFEDKIHAQAQKNQLSDREVKDVKKEFNKTKTYRCRVIGFDYADRVVLVTLKQSVLKQQFLSFKDINLADIVKCKIQKFHDHGVTVKLGGHMTGYIHNTYLADVPLRKPDKKFDVDDELQCKVLYVNVEKQKMYLTHKKSQISSKYPDLISYDHCRQGLITEGVVFKIKERGLIVKFFGDVQGYVPKTELSTEKIDYLDQAFYIGQVVRCIIKFWNPEEKKLILSLKVGEKTPFTGKKTAVPEDFELGKMVTCTVTDKTDAGLEVILEPSKMAAILPTVHLSDHHSNCIFLKNMYKVGDTIDDAMYYEHSNAIVLSRKKVLKDSNTVTAHSFDDLQPGMLIPGVVTGKQSYGLFIRIAPKLSGLCPNKYICDRWLDTPSTLYEIGQSVVAKVIEVDNEKQRFLISLRMSDCYHGDIDEGLDLLSSYLDEFDQIMETLREKKGKKLGRFTMGQVVDMTVSEVTDIGVLCIHDNGVKGFVITDNMPGVMCTVGETIQAVVLYVDPQAKCLELSLNVNLIKSVRNYNDSKFCKVSAGQKMNAEVHLVKDQFILVSLTAHALGQLAFLPARKHPNDAFEKQQYTAGQVNAVTVKRTQDHHIICCLEMHNKETESLAKPPTDNKYKHKMVKEGDILDAKISSVHEMQLNIFVGDLTGRVHISDITDNPIQGENPLSNFSKGKLVKVKVMGLIDCNKTPEKPRRKQKGNYLPISKAKSRQMFAECTMKASELDDSENSEVKPITEPTYEEGQTVGAYVIGVVSSTYLLMALGAHNKGRVHILNASTRPGVNLKDFKSGSYYDAHILDTSKPDCLELSLIDKPQEISVGSRVLGVIKTLHPSKGMILELVGGVVGRVSLLDVADQYTKTPLSPFTLNQCVEGVVLTYDKECQLSLRPSRMHTDKDITVEDPEIRQLSDIHEHMILHGYVQHSDSKGIFVNLGRGLVGRVPLLKTSRSNLEPAQDFYKPGRFITIKVESIVEATRHVHLSIVDKDSEAPLVPPVPPKPKKIKKEKKKQNEKEKNTRKRKSSETEDFSGKKPCSEPEDLDSGVETEPPLILTDNLTAVPRLRLSAGFSWDTTFKPPISSVPQDNSDTDDDDEDTQITTKPKTKLEKKAEQMLEEQMLFERERMLMSGEKVPESVAEFDRLVLQSPDSSLVWLRYMAFHLQTAEIEKARIIAERALKTISFREEQEKMNVWVAYLNLENMYGTDDTLKTVFQRASHQNDKLKIYTQLIQIYTHSNKIKAAEDLYLTLVKRHSANKDIWVNFGSFYFEHNQAESGRKLMQRALKSLQSREHVEVIAKFAQMEFKHGEAERGKTIFENVLSNYPKRTDLWSVYIDMVTKLGDLDPVRQLYERVISMNLPTKKMKFFFKKFLTFEQRHGTSETVEAVRQKALDYVENSTDAS